MKPVSPVVPGYQIEEVVFNSKDPEVAALPAVVTDNGNSVLIHFELSPEDRARVAAGQDLYVWQSTYGRPFQPIAAEIRTPDELVNGRDTKEETKDESTSSTEEDWPDVIGGSESS